MTILHSFVPNNDYINLVKTGDVYNWNFNNKPIWEYRGIASSLYAGLNKVLFDSQSELLWTADQYGYISSFLFQKPIRTEAMWDIYSSFRGFKEPVLDLVSIRNISSNSLICSVSSTGLIRINKSGGAVVKKFDLCNSLNHKRLQSINYVSLQEKDKPILYVLGDFLMEIDLDSSNIITKEIVPLGMYNDTSHITAFKVSESSLIYGEMGGKVLLYDLNCNMGKIQEVQTNGKITSLDVMNNKMYIASYYEQNVSNMYVYDMRNLSNPLNIVNIPGYIIQSQCYLSNDFDCSCFITTINNGLFVINESSTLPIYQQENFANSFSSASVSGNGLCAVVADTDGHFYTFTNINMPLGNPTFNSYNKLPPQPKKSSNNGSSTIDISADFNESYPKELLSSNWPPEHYMCGSMHLTHRQLPPSLLSRIQPKQVMMNYIGATRSSVYQPDPKDHLSTILPDPYPFNERVGIDPHKAIYKLRDLHKELRQKQRRYITVGTYYSKPEEAQQVAYENGFDWQLINASTDVVGLDNSYPESWIGPILQCLFHVGAPHYPLRKAIMSHLCKKYNCVVCEIGILFSNMQTLATHCQSSTRISQPQNVYRAMRQSPEFINIGLKVTSTSREDAVLKLHETQRLLLKIIDKEIGQLLEDTLAYPESLASNQKHKWNNVIAELLGTELQISSSTIPPQLHWDVPASASKVDEGLQHLLKIMERHKNERVTIKSLPPILVLLLNPEHGSLQPPSNLKFTRSKEEYNYMHHSSIIHLAYDKFDPGHFVNHIRSSNDTFFIINDYIVSNTGKEEELQAHIPAIMPHSTVCAYYCLCDYKPTFKVMEPQFRFVSKTCPNLLKEDIFLSKICQIHKPLSNPLHKLSIAHIATKDIIALDAEYVTLNWCNEEIEIDAKLDRKPVMSLARLSCLLSSYNGDERVIIDDYIATNEPVQDYVTQYSGIFENDLNYKVSTKPLTTPKATYLKLKLLMEQGVMFLGHGLAQDFRILNIAVPSEQIIDTVELFRQTGGRKLRLRYLAYYLLGEKIQEKEHDSIEDARTALRLFRKYEEMKRQGTFSKTLQENDTKRNYQQLLYSIGFIEIDLSSAYFIG